MSVLIREAADCCIVLSPTIRIDLSPRERWAQKALALATSMIDGIVQLNGVQVYCSAGRVKDEASARELLLLTSDVSGDTFAPESSVMC